MRILYPILLSASFFINYTVLAQRLGDSKIIVTVSDTTNIYERVRIAMAKADLIVKELNIRDTIITFPRELKSMSGFAVVNAITAGNKITFSGFYSRRKLDSFGYSRTSKEAEPIIYYKKGKLWSLLVKIANEIGGDQQYSK